MSEIQQLLPHASDFPEFDHRQAWQVRRHPEHAITFMRESSEHDTLDTESTYEDSTEPTMELHALRKLLATGSLVEQSNLRGLQEQVVELQQRMGYYPSLHSQAEGSFDHIKSLLHKELQTQRELQVARIADYLARTSSLWIVTSLGAGSHKTSKPDVQMARLDSIACDFDSQSVVPVVRGKNNRSAAFKSFKSLRLHQPSYRTF